MWSLATFWLVLTSGLEFDFSTLQKKVIAEALSLIKEIGKDLPTYLFEELN